MIDKMISELMKLEYKGDNYMHAVILNRHKQLVQETLLKVYNEEYDHQLGELKAKVYAYENIIANSNFKPILDKGE